MSGRIGAVALAAVSLACGSVVGGGGGEPGDNSVSGAVGGGRDFNFTPTQVSASFSATSSGEGDLSIDLCEGACPALGGSTTGRALALRIHGSTADLRSGRSFAVPSEAQALAQYPDGAQSGADEANGGEVVVASSDLREGGVTVGTFQLRMGSGGSVSGFFEAVLREVQGPVVVLQGARQAPPPGDRR